MTVPAIDGRTVAVLGATGLIGRHVIAELQRAGARQIVASYRSRPPFEAAGVVWRRADLMVPEEARAALQGVDAAVLSAGKISSAAELRRDPSRSVLETLRIGINALEAAAQQGVGQAILLSSCTGYPAASGLKVETAMFDGDPPPAWFGVGWTHRFLEKQLEWYSAHLGRIGTAVTLRPTLVYGPHDDFDPKTSHFVPSMIHQVVARQRPIEVWGDGSQTRNLIHAADVAGAVMAALALPPGYAAYNVAARQSASVNEVLKLLVEVDGFADAEIVHRLDKQGGASALHVSAEALTERTGWQPQYSLRAGLAATMRWYRERLGSAR